MSEQEIFEMLAHKGEQQYGGEGVTQLEHALQCAMLAEKAQANPALITACLFHDLGHLMHNLGENIAADGIDDRHEYRGLEILSKLFLPQVTEPIRLHVEAKRYLCAVNTKYYETLSSASKKSLELQGGVFTLKQAEQFQQSPYASDAIKLRIWDEQAKIPHLTTPSLYYFQPVILTCLN
ncbi:MAG: HD domain-containing protein [Gomphosphaeria aponina SAG 52.96 = DSM 107014]|uniref:HD domain-containing protein n=1 Tax=Gomphosphaeria aponina SAG 52.96 = DSM 107014 TaxID=1521640 RepID=A0A941GRG1_9CHRO|nr:HD domain-containing protein [Gomphosphaeria aponina SAG 52.96 = DSM 107014]